VKNKMTHQKKMRHPGLWPLAPSPGGADCKNDPPFAPPDSDPSPQPTETKKLKMPQMKTRHTRKSAPPAPPAPGPAGPALTTLPRHPYDEISQRIPFRRLVPETSYVRPDATNRVFLDWNTAI